MVFYTDRHCSVCKRLGKGEHEFIFMLFQSLMIGYYNYAVILTYISMLISFGGISYVVDDKILAACICLLISGICDTFDGKIAQTKVRTPHEKRFGIQLDSLADTVCFGILPAVIVYHIGGPRNHVTLAVAGFYALTAIIRLAWFNVDEEQRQNTTSGCREFYTGLPVTVSAFVLPVVLAASSTDRVSMMLAGTIALLVLGVAFISPVKVPKLNFSLGHQKNDEQEDHSEQ